jgi:hypothetical protein
LRRSKKVGGGSVGILPRGKTGGPSFTLEKIMVTTKTRRSSHKGADLQDRYTGTEDSRS